MTPSDQLRAALEPFAKAAGYFEKKYGAEMRDSFPVYDYDTGEGWEEILDLGDFRRAASALAETDITTEGLRDLKREIMRLISDRDMKAVARLGDLVTIIKTGDSDLPKTPSPEELAQSILALVFPTEEERK